MFLLEFSLARWLVCGWCLDVDAFLLLLREKRQDSGDWFQRRTLRMFDAVPWLQGKCWINALRVCLAIGPHETAPDAVPACLTEGWQM